MSSPARVEQQRVDGTIIAYVVMAAAGIATVLLACWYGGTLTAPLPVPLAKTVAAAPPHTANALLHVLIALAAVFVLGRVLGLLLRALAQPPVIGEVLAGILLGPSLLGHLAPGVSAWIMPPGVAPWLNVVAQVGVVVYMFVVGLELNGELLGDRLRTTLLISHAGIVVPFALGTLLALALYPRFSTSDVPFTSFALFTGVAMSITAFPVLARILTDRGASATPLGVTALTCAAVDDVTAWCLLAFVVGLVAQARAGGAVLVVVLTMAFIGVVWLVIHPWVVARVARTMDRPPSGTAIVLALLALLISALVTEWIGIHAVFGAFLAGAIIPHNSPLARTLKGRFGHTVAMVLLPAFFAFTGLRTEIGRLSGWYPWMICGLIVAVATLGKFGGVFVAALATGRDRRQSASLAVLMNTRGLMELIVLNIGFELGVISPTIFTMMVVMALVTTIMASPVLQWLGTFPARGPRT